MPTFAPKKPAARTSLFAEDLTPDPTLIRWGQIQLAEHEWDTTHPLHEIAELYFRADPDPDGLILTVLEHAGWWAEFGWVRGQVVTLGTANCANGTPLRDELKARLARVNNQTMMRTLDRNKEPDARYALLQIVHPKASA